MATWLQKLGAWLSKTAKDNTGYFNATGEEKAASAYGTRLTGAQQQMNQYNAEQAQIARDWQEEMYQKYQSPSAMMSQYRDAGLNPALMYGSAGSGSMPSASSANGSVVGSTGSSGLSELNNTVSQAVQIWQTIAGTKKDLDLKDSQIKKNNADAEYTGTQNEWFGKSAQSNITLNEWKAKAEQQGIKESEAREAFVIAQKVGQEISNEYAPKLAQLQVDYQTLQNALTEQETKLTKAQTSKVYKEIGRIQYEMKNIMADTLLKYSETNKNNAEIKCLKYDEMSKKFVVDHQELNQMIEVIMALSKVNAPLSSVGNTLSGHNKDIQDLLDEIYNYQ